MKMTKVNVLTFSLLFLRGFLSVADLSATDYGIAAECSLCLCVSVCVSVCLCQPLKCFEVSLRFFLNFAGRFLMA